MRATNQAGDRIIGNSTNFWLFNNRDGFDLTHPRTPDSPSTYPRMTLQTSTSPITIAPHKTALVIIDMQNFFLSSATGREPGPGHEVEKILLETCVPAARKAGIQIIWLCWGLSDSALEKLPPLFYRNWSMSLHSGQSTNSSTGKLQSMWYPHKEGHFGMPLGDVTLENGTSINAGRSMMRDQWNTELHAPLLAAYHEGLAHPTKPDVKLHKCSHSGFWSSGGSTTELAYYLCEQEIKTLLFAGVNADHCVLSTLSDAAQQGYDSIMAKDACGNASPEYARQGSEFNVEKALGFSIRADELLKAAESVVQKL